jgi:hypothetical protein
MNSLTRTYGVDEKKIVREKSQHCLNAILDLLFAWNTRRMDVVYAGTDLVGIPVLLEGLQELHITLRSFNGDDISIETLNGRENIVEIGVTEVGVSLSCISDSRGGQAEAVNSPGKISIPIDPAQRKLDKIT